MIRHLYFALPAFVITSCNVARENVLASVNTVIGLSVAQNEKNAAYEAKAGYIRNQIYSVPTGKTVENSSGQPVYSPINDADRVPNVVGALVVESGVKELFIGMNVKELFATGTDGVNSAAATAMFVANAETPAHTAETIKAVEQIDDL
ncbi:hypothetical protein [Haloferula sargassicola]|uniref:Uncharacterized protein n=1 Tax=Haloferula sargassicola TaxID=490096 RepID=A0ABP9UP58_9BACT